MTTEELDIIAPLLTYDGSPAPVEDWPTVPTRELAIEIFTAGLLHGVRWFESTILPLREKANAPPPDEVPWSPPADSKPDYMSESYRATRFVLIACDMWDAEHREPMCMESSKTWLEIVEAALRISRHVQDKRIGPALFKRWWEESGRTARIRPHYIPENWIAFIQWCKGEGVLPQ